MESHRRKTPIHPGHVKAKLTNMGVKNNNNPTPTEKYKSEAEVKEEYISCLMLDGADNGCFRTINTDLDNKMTCGSYSYPNTKDDTVGLINNFHVSKKLIRSTPV